MEKNRSLFLCALMSSSLLTASSITLDSTFNPNGAFPGIPGIETLLPITLFGGTATLAQANAAAVQADGKILVAGYATVSGAHSFAIARLDSSDGSLDPSFGTGGVKVFNNVSTFGAGTTVAEANGIAVQPSGQIVVAGKANPTNKVGTGVSTVAVLRLNAADGSLDPTFGTGGVETFSLATTFGMNATAAQANAIAIQADGSIELAGSANPNAMQSMLVMSLLATNGSLDPSFATNGVLILAPSTFGAATQATAFAMALQPNGKIVIAGSANPGGVTSMALARVNQMFGTLDGSFGMGGVVTIAPTSFGAGATSAQAFGVGVQSNGAIVVGGSANPGGITSMAAARLLAGGGFDTTFGTGGTVTIAPTTFAATLASAAALRVQSDGTVALAGNANPGGSTTTALALLNQTGAVSASTAFPLSNFGMGATSAQALALTEQFGQLVVAGIANPTATQSFNMIRLGTTLTANADALTLAILAAYCPDM